MNTDDPILPPEDDDSEGLAEPEALAPEPIAPALESDELPLELEDLAPEPVPIAEAITGSEKDPVRPLGLSKGRPDLQDRREPLYRDCKGYRLRLDPPDLARLRELAGARGKSDDELGEAFFDGQAERLAASILDDVPTPSEIRVVVDPYSRQAFLALENRIRGILSF
jgi:hypothetical protein